MDPLEYSFGTGADAPVAWTSPADLDLGPSGGVDAVRLDFDGDGLLDDAMWDSDGDGVADRSVLDYDAEDESRYFTDPSGDGTWNAEIPREPPVIAAVHTWRPDPVVGTAETIDAGAQAGQGGLGFQTYRGFDEENTR
ncbi:hypothetical protein [Rhodococcus koreensis]|uniref:hypothetical protein n=1 Tax=Rhodococcus koreensis TaxID=99653 RepID=UPI0036D86964